MDLSMSYEARIEGFGYTVGCIRYWNAWLDAPAQRNAGYSRTKNGLTTETCTDIEIAAGAAITHIYTCSMFRDKFGKNSLKLSDSVCCRFV